MFNSFLIVLKTLSSVNSIILVFSNQGNFRKSLNMQRLRIFELGKSKINHEKGRKKFYPMTIFSKKLTETILSKNGKNPEIHPKTGYINKKFLIMMTNYRSLKSS